VAGVESGSSGGKGTSSGASQKGSGSSSGADTAGTLGNGGDDSTGSGTSSGSPANGSTGSSSGFAGTASSSGTGETTGSSSGSSGTTSSSSSGTTSSSSGGVDDANATTPTALPTVSGTCPTYSAGAGSTVTFSTSGGSIQAQVWAGAPKAGGPIILYWNGTASSPGVEVPLAFDVNAVTAAGGLIVGFVSGSRTGSTGADTGGDLYWFSTDVAFADQAVACAVKQYQIDPRHIHVAGYSAGALQTVYMWGARSGYVASVISYSGGYIAINGPQSTDAPFENAGNIAPAIAAHGAVGSDNLIVDFANASTTWEGQIKMAGGFSIDCNDGGNHTDFFTKRAPPLQPVAWKFFSDHPYGIKPEPYSSLPSGFPTYCKID
jgi:hypothetical protein